MRCKKRFTTNNTALGVSNTSSVAHDDLRSYSAQVRRDRHLLPLEKASFERFFAYTLEELFNLTLRPTLGDKDKGSLREGAVAKRLRESAL